MGFLYFLAVVGGALWVWSDLKRRMPSMWALGASLGIAVAVYLVGAGIASIIPVVSHLAHLIGAGSSVAASVLIARPVSQRMRRIGPGK